MFPNCHPSPDMITYHFGRRVKIEELVTPTYGREPPAFASSDGYVLRGARGELAKTVIGRADLSRAR